MLLSFYVAVIFVVFCIIILLNLKVARNSPLLPRLGSGLTRGEKKKQFSGQTSGVPSPLLTDGIISGVLVERLRSLGMVTWNWGPHGQ